ncbi:hypothetical protein KUTeg_021545 [Tegillarca granosa]|uniref:Telomere length and silencing protein 1 homolog n=1 Tax=Tegillarca granosa TaxID=220873 RepID=A0ABQ9E8B3_TEGGR|nr:hypothetical protein KUTeg_021545 [Tegillarca granosa]
MTDFKKSRSRSLRKRRHSSSDDDCDSDEEDIRKKIQDIKELQKEREKPNGVDIAALALGKKLPKEAVVNSDPFKMETGGMVDMKALKKKLKYVEVELARRKGRHKSEEEINNKTKTKEDMLFELPENLKVLSKNKKTEDMLSNQMLSGIPEVDLGIEAKIKNIEATEESKQKLIEERRKKKEHVVSDFVPTNMAVNFMQHNRFTIEDNKPVQKKQEDTVKIEPVRVGDVERLQTPLESGNKSGNKADEKATDDFYFEKFRKQMRRF